MVRALLMTVALLVGLSMVSVSEAGWRHRRCGNYHYRGCATTYHGSYYHGGCYDNPYYGSYSSGCSSCGGASYHAPSTGCASGVCR
ncbi:hypothetical protein Pan97_03490 [Bremerella volcania]|uniref:Uncharacterized protein n=1 Tax=Bremerella volcania TaxID=2527984 RepID=A0A518C2C9_9BACT|nr:hypothetical protein [Bremerella volcania]QDU73379.1 hypothetical protein Pan97_03490 [Bremerella volcania]